MDIDLIAPRMEPNEKRMWFLECKKCEWRSEPEFKKRDVRPCDECPECGSSDLAKESDYYEV